LPAADQFCIAEETLLVAVIDLASHSLGLESEADGGAALLLLVQDRRQCRRLELVVGVAEPAEVAVEVVLGPPDRQRRRGPSLVLDGGELIGRADDLIEGRDGGGT